MALLSPFLEVPIIRFFTIMKNGASSRLQFQNLCNKCNFFYTRASFLFFLNNAKNEDRLCPLPYEEVLEDIIKTVWTEQCGNLEVLIEIPGEGCTSLPRVKPG